MTDVPKNIGCYKIEKEKYKMSNSDLYIGINTNINEKVLIDVFKKENIKSQVDNVSLRNNEVFILKLLNHKNILKLYDIIETPSYIFLIFEYFEGKTLADYIAEKKQLGEDEAVLILKEVLTVLSYLHGMNLCHLNINSSNIIIDDQKRLKLYDYKYSHFYSSKQKDKVLFIGDPAYTSPELHAKKQYNPELADMWSLGILLYNILTGTLPFVPKKNTNLLRTIIKGEYGIPTHLPENMKNLIKSLLEKEDKRLKMDDIFNNPAFKSKNITKDSLVHGLNVMITKYPIDNLALNICKNNYKLDVAPIIKGLENNRFTQATSLFKQIVTKLYNKGFPNISDLNSDKFLAYINDNNNYHAPEMQAANMQKYLKLEEDIRKNTKDLSAILFNNQNEISTRLNEIKEHLDMLKKGIKPPRENNSVEGRRRRRNSFDADRSGIAKRMSRINKGNNEKGKAGGAKRNTVVLNPKDMKVFGGKGDSKNPRTRPGGRFTNVEKKIIEEEKEEDEPKKEEPKKEEPKKEEPKKVEPKKEEPKKVEPKKVEPKKPEPKQEKIEEIKLTKVILKKEEPKPKTNLVKHVNDPNKINDNINSNAKKIKFNEEVRKKEEEGKINKVKGGLKKVEQNNPLTKSMGNINSAKKPDAPPGGFKSIKEMIEFNIKKNSNNAQQGGLKKVFSNGAGLRAGTAKPKK